MKLNVFSHPTSAFESALTDPNVLKSIAIVIIAGLLVGLAGYIANGDATQLPSWIGVNLAQWILLSVLLWFFEFMLTSGKKRRFGSKNFPQALSAVGTLWVVMLVVGVVFNLAIFALISQMVILCAIFVIVLAALFVWYIISAYLMIKTTLEAGRGKTIAALILLLILDFLIMYLGKFLLAGLF